MHKLSELIEKIKTLINDYKEKQRRKELKRKIRWVFKIIFSKKTMQKVVIAFVSIALIASYILPYIVM